MFPFKFSFEIEYALLNTSLKVTYSVVNTGDFEMFFSVGGHPAFNVPLEMGLTYQDYYLEFDEMENAGRWPISAEGLIEKSPVPFFENTNKFQLTKPLFYQDALVLNISGLNQLIYDPKRKCRNQV